MPAAVVAAASAVVVVVLGLSLLFIFFSKIKISGEVWSWDAKEESCGIHFAIIVRVGFATLGQGSDRDERLPRGLTAVEFMVFDAVNCEYHRHKQCIYVRRERLWPMYTREKKREFDDDRSSIL